MEYERYLFKETTNFDISTGIYDIICLDAYRFKFIKDKKPNVGGYINELVPNLNSYREDLHERLLKANKGDEKLVSAIENSIYGIYLDSFDFSTDASTNLSFRINKEHKNDFIYIHDSVLQKVDMGFTAYIKSLLNEYASKPFFQREMLKSYKIISSIEECIKYSEAASFYMDTKEIITAVPLSIEPILEEGGNQIPAISEDKKEVYLINLGQVSRVSKTSKKIKVTDDDMESVMDFIDKETSKGDNEEGKPCSD